MENLENYRTLYEGMTSETIQVLGLIIVKSTYDGQWISDYYTIYNTHNRVIHVEINKNENGIKKIEIKKEEGQNKRIMNQYPYEGDEGTIKLDNVIKLEGDEEIVSFETFIKELNEGVMGLLSEGILPNIQMIHDNLN